MTSWVVREEPMKSGGTRIVVIDDKGVERYSREFSRFERKGAKVLYEALAAVQDMNEEDIEGADGK